MALVYSSASDVRARVVGRAISTTTAPTTAQVEEWLLEAEAMLLGALASCGIAAPAAATNGGLMLKAWACDFAEGHTRNAWAATAGDDNKVGDPQLERFDKQINAIYDNPARWGGALNAGAVSSSNLLLRGPNTDTSADDYIAPEFERDQVY